MNNNRMSVVVMLGVGRSWPCRVTLCICTSQVLTEVEESVRTGLWVGDCFIYTNSVNRLNYYVGGEIVTIAHLDRWANSVSSHHLTCLLAWLSKNPEVCPLLGEKLCMRLSPVLTVTQTQQIHLWTLLKQIHLWTLLKQIHLWTLLKQDRKWEYGEFLPLPCV